MSAHTSEVPALLTTRETAAALRCSPATVRRLVVEHVLEPVRLRQVAGGSLLFRASDVRALVEPREPEDAS
jgi:excisionase family DNA binding protein